MKAYSHNNPRPSDGTFERLILDLTKTGIPIETYGTLHIPCRRGLYWMDFDILMEELPPFSAAVVRSVSRSKVVEKYGSSPEEGERLPVGFNVIDMPPGAALIRETGGNCHVC